MYKRSIVIKLPVKHAPWLVFTTGKWLVMSCDVVLWKGIYREKGNQFDENMNNNIIIIICICLYMEYQAYF